MNNLSTISERPRSPEEEELERKKVNLAALEAQLADQELELASCLADLVHFEKRYLQTVGRRYAILDELKAKIAEASARQNPNRQHARERAQQARARAEESARSVGEEIPEPSTPDGAASASRPRSESLRNLY